MLTENVHAMALSPMYQQVRLKSSDDSVYGVINSPHFYNRSPTKSAIDMSLFSNTLGISKYQSEFEEKAKSKNKNAALKLIMLTDHNELNLDHVAKIFESFLADVTLANKDDENDLNKLKANETIDGIVIEDYIQQESLILRKLATILDEILSK